MNSDSNARLIADTAKDLKRFVACNNKKLIKSCTDIIKYACEQIEKECK